MKRHKIPKDPVEEALMSVPRAFEVQKLLPLLRERKNQVAIQNKDIKPYVDARYWCETCGNRTGECHPDTGYCFICDTDNWEPHNYRDVL